MSGSYDPQIVGSHFVKQYYTQLHKDPVQLHRFYLDQSSYVHGSSEIGSEQPVVGQKAIHEKILSINFKSVHAKIKQVDSHATLGEGIVIQVTGELSVNGQPMRAFVQTFVLAPESPKKYYVHNDIFRYQDDVYDATSESENNEALTDRDQDTVQVHSVDSYQQQQGPVDVGLQNGNRQQPLPPPAIDQITSADGKDGWVQFNDNSGAAVDSASSDTSTPLDPSQMSKSPEPGYKSGDPVMQIEEVAMTTPTGGSQEYSAEEDDKSSLSWAGRLSQATGATIAKVQPPPSGQVIQQLPPPATQPQQTVITQQPQLEPRKKPVDNVPGNTGRTFSNTEPSRRPYNSRSVPDTYQLFIGGLPGSTSDQELRTVFEQFGSILEIRNNPNNFAFLVFDSEKPVKTILSRKEPLKIRGKQLNIEKKKQTFDRPSGRVVRRDNFTVQGQRPPRVPPKNKR